MSELPRSVRIREVGPRDGFQNEPEVIATADKVRLIEMLGRAGHLHPAVDVDTAADVFYGLVNEEVFQFFVGDCGWDVDRFQQWLTAALLDQLLATN